MQRFCRALHRYSLQIDNADCRNVLLYYLVVEQTKATTYKLEPLHQGIVERGSKTGSLSYMLLPCRVGAYSVVIDKHGFGNNGDESVMEADFKAIHEKYETNFFYWVKK